MKSLIISKTKTAACFTPNLILPSPPNVSAHINDFFTDGESGQDVVKLLHGLVDDVLDAAGDVHLLHQLLVPGQGARHVIPVWVLCTTPVLLKTQIVFV